MAMNTLDELFEHELEDVYNAEHELLDALDELAEETHHEEISRAFREHRQQTERHIERLEEVFEMIGEPPEQEECEGIKGLIREHEEFMEMDPGEEVTDIHNMTAAEKTEHYEIAAYGNLAKLANQLGMSDAGDLLHENLVEEQETLDRLKDLSDQFDYEQVTA